MKDKLSIKEFSKLVGVSEQAIYKRLNNTLKPYCSTVDNRKMIDIAAAKEIYNVESLTTFNNQKVEKFNNPLNHNDIIVNTLKEQLAAANKDKEKLYQELETKNEQIKTLNETLRDLGEQVQASQQILLREQELLYLEMKSQEEEKGKKKKGLFRFIK